MRDFMRMWRAVRRPRAARHDTIGLRFSARRPLFDMNRALERVAVMNRHAKISVIGAAKLLLSGAIVV
jgi:hypothetical protein